MSQVQRFDIINYFVYLIVILCIRCVDNVCKHIVDVADADVSRVNNSHDPEEQAQP